MGFLYEILLLKHEQLIRHFETMCRPNQTHLGKIVNSKATVGFLWWKFSDFHSNKVKNSIQSQTKPENNYYLALPI